MNASYFVTARAGKMYEMQMQTLSHNMANVNTSGYREDRVSFSSVLRETAGSNGELTEVPYNVEQQVNLREGLVQPTGGELDVALRGNAYFRLQLPEGGEAYSRAGHFHIDGQGTLLNMNELPVLDDNGAPITIKTGNVVIDEQGKINVDGKPLTSLGIVAIKDAGQVERIAGSMVKTDAANTTTGEEKFSVLQGSLESSNVNAVEVMTSLISLTRSYQQMLKTMEQYSEQIKSLSDKVGTVGGA
ncbi:MAG: flagellar hook-basal body protein [Zetaproteobacteria bacterium]|nr:flagellar hook-basal body protein [Zetaproteobacteria bacterium]